MLPRRPPLDVPPLARALVRPFASSHRIPTNRHSNTNNNGNNVKNNFPAPQLISPRPEVRRIARDPEAAAQNAINRGLDKQYALHCAKEVARLTSVRRTLDGAINAERRERKKEPAGFSLSPPNQSERNALRERRIAIQQLERERTAADLALRNAALPLPNWTHPQVPAAGESPRIMHVHGRIPDFPRGFKPLSHTELNQRLGVFSFSRASVAAGEKFFFLQNGGALLELAIVNWAMHRLAEKGWEPLLVPDVVRDEVVAGCGFSPASVASQTYGIEGTGLCLSATAEIALAGSYANQITMADQLPRRTVGFSHAFRREAGGAGRETQGLYRVRQFSKVEMFVACSPLESEPILDELVSIQTELFSELGLHFRVLDMPADDLGAPAFRKFDIEAWMPSRAPLPGGPWGEISSASNCTDYQSRLLNARFKVPGDEDGTQFLHFVNGTAAAVPRLIMAIMETHQQRDGSVLIPPCLREFMPGRPSALVPRIIE